VVKFSVILPTFNDAENIVNAIDSVLSQTEKDFEVIVIDDASTDETYKILEENIKDKRVRITRHEINMGPGAARNTGLKEARGQYVAFLDSDDLWHPKFLENFASEIIIYNRALGYGLWFSNGHVYCGEKYLCLMPQSIWCNNVSREDMFKRLYTVNCILTQGVVVDRDVFDRCGGFDETLRSAQDYDMWLNMARITSFHFIDKPLFIYNVRKDTVSSNISRRINCQLAILKKHEQSIREITATSIEFNLLKHKAKSMIYSSASWEIEQRSDDILYAFSLASRAFLLYPGIRNSKRLLISFFNLICRKLRILVNKMQ
jgi:glycosyltransferase involved in cell wall biosynthesis